MKIELTDREVRRIVPILRTQYHKSYNLWEIAEIKGVLQKLGETVEDWTPSYQELEKNRKAKMIQEKKIMKDKNEYGKKKL